MNGLNSVVVYGRVIAASRIGGRPPMMQLRIDTVKAVVTVHVRASALRAPYSGRMILITGTLNGEVGGLVVVAREVKQPEGA